MAEQLEDSTALRKRIAQLEANVRMYRALFDAAEAAILVLEGEQFIGCNQKALEVFGCTKEQLLAGTPFDFSPPLQPDGSDSAHAGRVMVEAAMAGEPQTFEWTHVRADGSPFEAEVHLAAVQSGKRTLLQATVRDVTTERRAQRSLAESENRLKAVLDTIPVRVFWKDLESRYLGCNRPFAEDAGLESPEQIIGRTDFELRWAEQARLYTDDDRQVMESGVAKIAYEEPQTHAEGKRIWLRTSKIPLRDTEGEIVGVLGAYEEITAAKRAEDERRMLEQQLQHAQKLESLGLLAGGIAHDFNNLLMAILGNADLAIDDLPLGSRSHRNLKEIETAAKRAAELCNQMLAYSGKGRFVIEFLDINRVIEETTHLLEVTIPKKAVLRFDLAEELPSIEGDAAQVRQICMNLVTNASEAVGEEGGRISIRTHCIDASRADLTDTYLNEGLPTGRYVVLEVEDDGAGMDPETRERIFDPFFTTKFTGRGLGMAAVLGIVRGHKGAIKFQSEPGEGTTFQVLFPARSEPADAARQDEADTEAWRGSGTVLIVDDEEVVLEVGRQMLERLGFRVLTAPDGRAAVEVFRQRTWHAKEPAEQIVCVLLDLTMPQMDGGETYLELRRIRPDVPVILSSGYNQQEVSQRFAGKGLAGFLQKPYQGSTLRRELRRVLEQG